MGIKLKDHIIKVNGKMYVPLEIAEQAIVESDGYTETAKKLDEVNVELKEALKFMDDAVKDIKEL